MPDSKQARIELIQLLQAKGVTFEVINKDGYKELYMNYSGFMQKRSLISQYSDEYTDEELLYDQHTINVLKAKFSAKLVTRWELWT